MSSKKLISSLKELRDLSLTERSTKAQITYQLPDQLSKPKQEKQKKLTPTCITFFEDDLSRINELKHFFLSNGEIAPKVSQLIRFSLILASNLKDADQEKFFSSYKKIKKKQ